MLLTNLNYIEKNYTTNDNIKDKIYRKDFIGINTISRIHIYKYTYRGKIQDYLPFSKDDICKIVYILNSISQNMNDLNESIYILKDYVSKIIAIETKIMTDLCNTMTEEQKLEVYNLINFYLYGDEKKFEEIISKFDKDYQNNLQTCYKVNHNELFYLLDNSISGKMNEQQISDAISEIKDEYFLKLALTGSFMSNKMNGQQMFNALFKIENNYLLKEIIECEKVIDKLDKQQVFYILLKINDDYTLANIMNCKAIINKMDKYQIFNTLLRINDEYELVSAITNQEDIIKKLDKRQVVDILFRIKNNNCVVKMLENETFINKFNGVQLYNILFKVRKEEEVRTEILKRLGNSYGIYNSAYRIITKLLANNDLIGHAEENTIYYLLSNMVQNPHTLIALIKSEEMSRIQLKSIIKPFYIYLIKSFVTYENKKDTVALELQRAGKYFFECKKNIILEIQEESKKRRANQNFVNTQQWENDTPLQGNNMPQRNNNASQQNNNNISQQNNIAPQQNNSVSQQNNNANNFEPISNMNAGPRTNIVSTDNHNQSVVSKSEANFSKPSSKVFDERSHQSETKQQINKKTHREENSRQSANTKNSQRALDILIDLCKKDREDERGGNQL